MQRTRILLYPEGTEDEIEFAEFEGTCAVPGVGERVQVIDNTGTRYDRGPMFEVVRRDFYSSRYAADSFVVEVALHVRIAPEDPV